MLFDFLYVFHYSVCFQKSLDSSIYPDVLNLSSIMLVFKSGDISNISNYRPITILSYTGKILESLVLQCIKLAVNQVLIKEQHRFRTRHSVTTYNLVFVNYIYNAFASGNQLDVFYIDFKKAFDRVNLAVLMKVLLSYGFEEPLSSLFRSYLNNRK